MEYLVFVGLLVWLTPWLLAVATAHPSQGLVLAVTLLTGWTVVGWGFALWWAWPERPPAPPTLRLVRPRAPLPRVAVANRPRATTRWRLRTGITICAVVLVGIATVRLLVAAWPRGAPHRETLVAEAAFLRSGPGADYREVGVLRAPCVVRVLDQSDGWKRVWKTSQCQTESTGRSEGWIRAEGARKPNT